MALLLTNGLVLDGTGRPGFPADVLIEGSRISAIDSSIAIADAERIDCAGLIVAPGFIDAHSHSDLQVLESRSEKADQGVTTEVVGNCGFSAFPSDANRTLAHEFANGIFRGGDEWHWASARDYLAETARRSSKMNVAALTGHGSLRVEHAGMRQGELTEADVRKMVVSLEDAFAGGSIGLSTGLMYAPGSSAPFEELRDLCAATARHDRIYCTHMRSYSWDLIESFDEQVVLARSSGCRLQISHLQAVGRANWHKQEQVFEHLERARKEGVDVEFDIYAYTAGSTVLTQLLPQSALDGGTAAMLARLTNAAARREVAKAAEDQLAQSWDDILISGVRTEANQPVVGRTVSDIAEQRGVQPVDAVIDLIVEEEGAVNMISFNQSEANLRSLLTHPLCTVISDSFYVHGRPHPRLFGAFPEFLGKYCRDKQWLDLAEALHKVTGKPAARFGLKERGLLRPGGYADITIFDAARIGTSSWYDDPEQAPTGIARVIREGRTILQNRDRERPLAAN